MFGPFEVNAHTGELRKRGVRVRLSGQPFQILLLLLAKPGDLVTREELREQLWSDGTFVDFEHGLNAAINKLRRALGDSAEHPRYIETAPGRGYRFIGVLERESELSFTGGPIPEESSGRRRLRYNGGLRLPPSLCLAVGFVLAWTFHDLRLASRRGSSLAHCRCRDLAMIRRCRPMAGWWCIRPTGAWWRSKSLGGRAGSLCQTRGGRLADPFDVRWRWQHDARFLAGR